MNRPSSGRIDPLALAADGFEDAQARDYRWSAGYDAVAYTELLQTHSDHGALAPEQLAGLLDAVGAAIREVGGGELVVPYRVDLVTTRRG